MIALFTHPLAIAIAFIWVGLILGISSLEAWLKFRAPGVTTAIGLGIGRLVFGALNKTELLLATVLVITAIAGQGPLLATANIVLSAIVAILIMQTVWLLPTLNTRALRVINDKPVASSKLHIIFIIAELAKMVLLVALGFSLFNDL